MSTLHSYPSNIRDIGYASLLEIKRWSYDDAQKEVMRNFNDAASSLQDTIIMDALGDVKNSKLVKGVRGITSGDDLVARYEQGVRTAAENTVARGGGDRKIAGVKVGNKRMMYHGPLANPEKAFSNTPVTAEELLGLEGHHDASWRDQGIVKDAYEAHMKRVQDFDAKQKGLEASSCYLALPNELQYEYGANWNNEFKLGTLALLSENVAALGGAMALSGGASLINTIQNNIAKGNTSVKDINKAEAVAGGVNALVDPFGVGTQVNPRNVVGLAGLAPNENAMQFFKKMDFRNFDMTFQFAARSAPESTQIEEIIQWFKVAMHPGTLRGSGNAILLNFPDVFQLIPKFVSVDPVTRETKLVRHPMLPRTKLCALTNLRVNTTPMNQLMTTHDGSFPLVSVNCRFTEITALTKGDFGQLVGMQDQRRAEKGKGNFVLQSKNYAQARADDDYYSY